MNEKRIILTVRATQDGTYGNYYYCGPIESDQGYTPGEVFQVDATPYIVMDGKGNPVPELNDNGEKIALLDVKLKQRTDEKGKKMWKPKMATMFSKTWMERVEDDTELTYPDRPKWKIPEAYRIKKTRPVRSVALPSDIAETAGISLPKAVTDAMVPEPKLEEVI